MIRLGEMRQQADFGGIPQSSLVSICDDTVDIPFQDGNQFHERSRPGRSEIQSIMSREGGYTVT